MKSNVSFGDKNVFVGIDVHKTTYSVFVLCESQVVGKASMPGQVKALLQYLKRFEGGRIHSVYEAGYFGFSLHRALEEQGISSLVVNPASVEVAANDRVKTDKRDAKKLAELLALGRLTGIRVPTKAEEEHRVITRTREQLVHQRTRVACQIRARISYLGLEIEGLPQHVGKRFIAKLLTAALPAEVKASITALATIWTSLDHEIAALDKALTEQAKEDGEKELIYRSAPGIGPLAARTLSNELGDMCQFKNERSLFSFTGLTPSEYSSGEKTYRGRITHQGAGRLRHVLVEAAWRAIKKDAALARIFRGIAARRGKSRAVVATARHLIGRLRACFRKGELWTRELQVIEG